jgi:uridine kinase
MTVNDLDFAELARQIRARPCPQRARLVAVDGTAGSGKSTFAALLAPYLSNAPIIPMDDFIAWDDLTDYVPRFEEQVLAPLLEGRNLHYQKRDWIDDMMGRGVSEFRDVPFPEIVIFEGIGSAQRALAQHLGYTIWIATPEELRLTRGLERDGHIDGMRAVWESFMAREKGFFELERTAERADLVVDGTLPFAGDPPRFRVLRQAPEPGRNPDE